MKAREGGMVMVSLLFIGCDGPRHAATSVPFDPKTGSLVGSSFEMKSQAGRGADFDALDVMAVERSEVVFFSGRQGG